MNAGLTVVYALSGVLAVVVAWLGYRDVHREGSFRRDQERIERIVQAALQPVQERQQDLNNRLERAAERQQDLQGELHDYVEKQAKVLDRLAVLETKTEVFWKSVAMDVARIIHSPDPARVHIDALLDAFMSGTISPGEAEELRGLLVKMRDWEPGDDIGFPVYAGEQVAAAILLRTMDHAMGVGT
jgi:TolA-binding protein